MVKLSQVVFAFGSGVFLVTGASTVWAQTPDPFEAAQTCARCHSDLQRPAAAVNTADVWSPPRMRETARPTEASVGPEALWRSSMMAHSAVDPYWRAKVRFEAAITPAAAGVIEDKCLSCHAPMQQYNFRQTGAQMRLDQLSGLGLEGVSCTVCHQITGEGFGERDSFTAGFQINNQRQIFGPHQNPFSNPMVVNSGYTPVAADHMIQSELCATCHTVITPTLSETGEVLGEFVEQAPYLEWLASSYPADGTTCQSCHMPTLKDATGDLTPQQIAHTPIGGTFGRTNPRTPFGQHFLVGGNTQVLSMLRELFPNESADLGAAEDRTRQSLSESLELRPSASLNGNRLTVNVKLVNRTGHKLPTAYPSRRMWVYLAVTDEEGRTVFESGAVNNQTGEIQGLGDASNATLEPHHPVITREDEVAIFEAEMADASGGHTVSLLRGNGYIKDNRILPRGFDLGRPQPAGIDPTTFAPVGVDGDADFLPGSDTVRYEIDLPSDDGPLIVTVRAYFQSVKPTHLAGMDAGRSTEEATFLGLYPRHNAPTVMREQILVVDR